MNNDFGVRRQAARSGSGSSCVVLTQRDAAFRHLHNEGWTFDIRSQGGVALRLLPHSIGVRWETLTFDPGDILLAK